MRPRSILFVLFSASITLNAQVVIEPSDMFTEIGQYSLNYRSSDSLLTENLQGSAGGPYVWDFQNGPTDHTELLEIVPSDVANHGDLFPGSTWAERQTSQDAEPGEPNWFYWHESAEGLVSHGIYSYEVNEADPAAVFNPAILDLPMPLEYGDSWTTFTQILTQIEYEGTTYDARIDYSTNNQIDAWGTLLVPQGEGECLRLNRVGTYDVFVETFFGWVPLTTYYTRTYFWVTENRGNAAMLTSDKTEAGAPPEDFAVAAAFMRMIETNHPGANAPEPVTSLQIVYLPGGFELSWDASEYAESYRLECSNTAGFDGDIQIIGETSGLSMFDAVDPENVTSRFYRVIALN